MKLLCHMHQWTTSSRPTQLCVEHGEAYRHSWVHRGCMPSLGCTAQRLRAAFALHPETGTVEPGAKQVLELRYTAGGGAPHAELVLAQSGALAVCVSEPLTGRVELRLPLRVSIRALFSR